MIFTITLFSGENTGYKHYDPSHPCSRCWKKYSKPFSGPIAYAPWSSPTTADPHQPQSNLNLQRPLRLLPSPTGHPHLHRHTSSLTNLSPNAYPALSRSATTATATLARRPSASLTSLSTRGTSDDAQANWIPLPGGVGGFPSSSSDGRQYVQTHGPPPPGAVVVLPGDPRLGGRPCWRCDGSGMVSVFFLLEERCDVCNGLGRVFS